MGKSQSSLQARLNDPEYKNWIKAGICLMYTKEGLEDFVDQTTQQLHQNVIGNLTKQLGAQTGQSVCGAVCGVTIRRQQLETTCKHPYCQAFINAVKQEGLDPTQPFTIRHGNLGNSKTSLWHSHSYELSKLFMNGGQQQTQSGPAETDLSGLVNFIAHCRVPSSQITSRRFLDEVRSARNEVVHTAEFKVTEPDLKRYSKSMINLLNDANIAASPRAQNAVTQIQTVTDAADFRITSEDEGRVMTNLANELQTLTVEIKQSLDEVKDNVEREGSEIRGDIKHGEEEMGKIKGIFIALQKRVDASSALRKKMGTRLKKVEKLLRDTILEHTLRLEHLEQQLSEMKRLEAEQKIHHEQTSQAVTEMEQLQIQTQKDIGILHTQRTQTNESIRNIKMEQDEYHRRTDEVVDDLRSKIEQKGQTSIPSEKDQLQLQEYLRGAYSKAHKLDVTLLPEWGQLHVSQIFAPTILADEEGLRSNTQLQSLKQMFCKDDDELQLQSYKEMFYDDDDELQKRVVLLGEAGTGKTTFLKHFTDVWCGSTSSLQFPDYDFLKQFDYLFYVSCRFASEEETILDMIRKQLFGDDDKMAVARYVLQHHPGLCLVLVDGLDEWVASPSTDTGRMGDIVGLPGLEGVEKCAIVMTSRPWRFRSMPSPVMSVFKRLRIHGIQNVFELAEQILQQLQDPQPKESAEEFLDQVYDKNMFDLMHIPLILIISLGGWVNDRSLHKSLCINYINMIQSLICRTEGRDDWSKGKLQLSVPNLDQLKTEWRHESKDFPQLLLRYKSLHGYASLFLSLGHLAFDLLLGKEEQSLVFSKIFYRSYLRTYDEKDESINVCLALGILSKTETTFHGLKKLESYAFCHKTFQEFFAALWLASKYEIEKNKLYQCIKTSKDLLGFEILIQFLCGFDPAIGKQMWLDVYAEMKVELREQVKVQELACRCMKELEVDPKDQKSSQVYFCIPHIWIKYNTSDEDIELLCHVMEEYYSNVKSVHVSDRKSQQQVQNICKSISYCSGLRVLWLQRLPAVSSVLDLQKHNKLERLDLRNISVEDLLLPEEGDTVTTLWLDNVTMTHHGLKQLEKLSSYTNLMKLYVYRVSCSDNDSVCIPVPDLQKHNKLEKLDLMDISVEGLLLPGEGATITSLELRDVTMTHHGLKQLLESLSSCTSLLNVDLRRVRFSAHAYGTCIPVIDLQKHNKLEKLDLIDISVEGLLLPVEGATITTLELDNVTMTHHGLEQLTESLSSCTSLLKVHLRTVTCSEHAGGTCIPVIDLRQHNKLDTLVLRNMSVEGLLLPGEGATITHLWLDNVTMTHHGLKQLAESLSSCNSLLNVDLRRVICSEHAGGTCIPVIDLRQHNKLDTLELEDISVGGILLPVEGATITTLWLDSVTMTRHGLKQLAESLSSCISLLYVDLRRVICSEHAGDTCIPVIDLRQHNKLKTLELEDISVEGLLLPEEGTTITSLELRDVTMTRHGLKQLAESLSSCISLLYVDLRRVRCSEHAGDTCIPVIDLRQHNKLDTLELEDISVGGILLPVEGATITTLWLDSVTMTRHGLKQLAESLSSCISLLYVDLRRVRCSEHAGDTCIPVIDLRQHNKLETLEMDDMLVEGLLMPVKGATITTLVLKDVTMTLHGLEQLAESLSFCIRLLKVDLWTVTCSEHAGGICIPAIDLRQHKKLETLALRNVSVEGLLLPEEGATITYLWLDNVTMTHHGLEQLEKLSSYTNLYILYVDSVSCSDNDSVCIPVLDLQQHNKLKRLKLRNISVESLLLPVGGATITTLELGNVIMTHHGLEQLLDYLSRLTRPRSMGLYIRCSEHGCDSSCQPLNDIYKRFGR